MTAVTLQSRRVGREQALQALYSIAVGRREPADAVSEVMGERETAEHRAFVRDLVLGSLEYEDSADRAIGPRLEGWTLERLPTIDRLILRVGAFELYCRPETPPAVVINEAVELAKKFSTEESGRFVNGVLSAVAGDRARDVKG